MTETLTEMTRRVLPFETDSVPNEAHFGYSAAVRAKVQATTGTLLPYFGNTVLFSLSDRFHSIVTSLTDALYEVLGSDVLAEPLPQTACTSRSATYTRLPALTGSAPKYSSQLPARTTTFTSYPPGAESTCGQRESSTS